MITKNQIIFFILLLSNLSFLIKTVSGVDAFPVIPSCGDDYTAKSPCLKDCRCGWCYNITKCFDYYSSHTCDVFITKANTKHCHTQQTEFALAMFITIPLIACCFCVFCLTVWLCGGVAFYINRERRGSSDAELKELI